MPSRWAEKQTFIARRFFLATVAQAVVCGLLAWILAVIIGPPVPTERVRIPGAFIAGTLFLIAGSWFLQCSIMEVRRERQIPFRRDLLLALVSAMLFVKTLLPVTFGDLGIREGIAVFFYGFFAVSEAAVFNASLLIFVLNFLLPALLGTFYLFKLRELKQNNTSTSTASSGVFDATLASKK